jgi:diguanylate cyclase (GGDEF)-like protein
LTKTDHVSRACSDPRTLDQALKKVYDIRCWTSNIDASRGLTVMDAEEYTLIKRINRQIKAFMEEGRSTALETGEVTPPLDELIETINRLVTRTEETERALSVPDFAEAGVTELARAARYGRELSVLSVQLDRYEVSLAEYGDAVVEVIRGAATRIFGDVLRATDVVGQCAEGGFGVILPETGVEYAAEVGERLRAAFEAEDVFTGDELILFTLSVGAAGMSDADERFEETYRRATEAMGAAAQAGGNQVATSDPVERPGGAG